LTIFNYEESFKLGHEYAKYVDEKLEDYGVAAELQPLEFATTKQERRRFTVHEKDVVTKAGVLEVKSSSRAFGDDPFSYPHESLIVDTAYGFANKARRPVAYCMVSQRTMGIVVVPTSSVALWWRDVLYDKHRQIHDEFLIAPKKVLRAFVDLVEWIAAK
jgi:hypothetical protein